MILCYGLAWSWYRAAGSAALVLRRTAALVSIGLAIRAAHDAHEADSATLRMRRLYELTRRTLEMDLHEEPGARLGVLIREIFELDAVAVFDADLQEVYAAGGWKTDPAEWRRMSIISALPTTTAPPASAAGSSAWELFRSAAL